MRPLLYFGCPSSERSETERLLRDAGFAVRWVDEAARAIAEIDDRFAPLLVDLRSEAAIQTGVEVRRQRPATTIVGIGDPALASASDDARRAGFTDVLESPLEPGAVTDVLAMRPLPSPLVSSGGDPVPGLVALSSSMQQVMDDIRRAGEDHCGGVLISGEPGTGRSYVARAFHGLYAPPGRRLVEVDCAPQPGADLETALFGAAPRPVVRDSSVSNKKRAAPECLSRTSLAYNAFGGTLLLLNLADMPLRVQSRLVRLLRDDEAHVAGHSTVRAAIRPIVCVDGSFDSLIHEGRVRPDLFKRLATHRINLPPLRERRADIPALIEQFLDGICMVLGVPRKTISHPAVTLLTSLPYSGNVRELRTLIRILVERTAGATIRLEDVLNNLRVDVAGFGAMPPTGTLREARVRFEQQYIRDVLERHRGRIADAARSLGIQRTNLYRKMRTLGVVKRSQNGANGPNGPNGRSGVR